MTPHYSTNNAKQVNEIEPVHGVIDRGSGSCEFRHGRFAPNKKPAQRKSLQKRMPLRRLQRRRKSSKKETKKTTEEEEHEGGS